MEPAADLRCGIAGDREAVLMGAMSEELLHRACVELLRQPRSAISAIRRGARSTCLPT
jgi:hypothetical protein